MMHLLAETAAAPDTLISGNWITSIVVAIIGALAAAWARSNGRNAGKAEAMQIGPQPFMVELKETFVTRREHDRLEGIVAVNAARTEGMFREAVAEMKSLNTATNKTLVRQSERLTQEIKDVATGAYLGRQKIHTSVNANAERLSKVEERADVAGEIGKMSEAIVEVLETIKAKN